MDTAVIDPSEVLHARAGQRVEDEARPEPSPELRAIEEEMSRRHWEAWLDTRVPALGNKTPRQAARTASGRERLEALLAEFDRHTGDGPSSVAAPILGLDLIQDDLLWSAHSRSNVRFPANKLKIEAFLSPNAEVHLINDFPDQFQLVADVIWAGQEYTQAD